MLSNDNQAYLVESMLTAFRQMCQDITDVVRDAHKPVERVADVSQTMKDILDVESVQKAARAIEENPEVALSIVRRLQRENAEHRAKWRTYEDNYVLPCFKYAESVGFDLRKAVSDNPGKNCVQLLVEHLIARKS